MNTKELLLAAHTKHNMQYFSSENLKSTISRSLDELYQWLEYVTLEEILSVEEVNDWIQRNLIERPPTKAQHRFWKKMAQQVYDVVKQSQAVVGDLISKQEITRISNLMISMEEMRHEIIFQTVNGVIYSMVATDMLYHGIRNFIVSENFFTRKVPGISSLVKIGQDLINMAAPELEENIEQKLTQFIQNNIRGIISQSESFLNQALNDTFLKKISTSIQATLVKQKIAQACDYIYEDHIREGAEIIFDTWLPFRTTPFYTQLCQAVVQSFFDQYGGQKMDKIIMDLGITKEVFADELYIISTHLFAKKQVHGLLTKIIKENLKSFYQSEAAEKIIGS